MAVKRHMILVTVIALSASFAHGGEKGKSQAVDVYTAAANAVRYARHLAIYSWTLSANMWMMENF